jgi:predicted phage baseplate assembly protein
MALDTVKLDDLNWGEMVVAIRRRIAAASAGEWTLHAPVDPGITLLELFAFLLEQRVYWMDQVPDSLVRGALSLLGERPHATKAAATVMHFPSISDLLLLPANEEFTLLRSEPPLIFSGHTEVALLPFEKIDEQRERLNLFIDQKDRTADLEHGKVLRLFPADDRAGEVKIILWLRELLPKNIEDKSFSLLFELYESDNVIPQWSPETYAAVPPPATISWFYSAAGGKRLPFSPTEINDGTGGLRRSGVVTLPIKRDWEPEDFDRAKQSYRYAVSLVVDKTTFSAPPRLKRLIPNVVIASHKRETTEHTLKREWLPLAGNEIVLADLPEGEPRKDYPSIENTMKLQIRERGDGKWHQWDATDDLAFHGPADRVFITDRALGKITFGDGLTGRLPVLKNDGGGQLKVQYAVGGGTAGRLGANLRWNTAALASLNGTQTIGVDFLDAVNVVQTTGGEEPETIPAFRERAAAALKSPTRAIIPDDYKQIACSVPGVAIKRAYAAIGFHPNYPCVPIPGAVTVFIVPEVSRPDVLSDDFDDTIVETAFVAAPVPDAGALAMVGQALDKARLAGTEVIVLAPYYREVRLSLVIESNAADRSELSRKIKQRLYKFFDPLIGGDPLIGADEGDGWPFGEPVRPSAILREAQRVLGDQGTILEIFISLPGGPSPDRQLETLSDAVFRDCSMLQKDSAAGSAPCGASALGSQEVAAFKRCHPNSLHEGVLVAEQTCADVEIGAHHLVKLLPIELHFQRAVESQGGLR